MDLQNKYRPLVFEDVVGQEFTKNVLLSDLKRGSFSPSYVFEGDFGSGKCVTGETLVYPANSHPVDISTLWIKNSKQHKDSIDPRDKEQVFPFEIELNARETTLTSSLFYRQRARPLRIWTTSGFTLAATDEHPVLILQDGRLLWKKVSELNPGNTLVTVRPHEMRGMKKFPKWRRKQTARNHKKWIERGVVQHPGNLWKMDHESFRWFLLYFFDLHDSDTLDFGSDRRLADIVHTRAYDAGMLLTRSYLEPSLLTLPSEYQRFRRNEEIPVLPRQFTNHPAYGLGSNLHAMVQDLPEDCFTRQFIKKSVRNRMLTRFLLLQMIRQIEVEIQQSAITNPSFLQRFHLTKSFLDDNILLEPVAHITREKETWVYDFTIPNGQQFKSNAFLSHNTTLARIFSRATICESPTPAGSPCNECFSCTTHLQGKNQNVLEINAADTNSVNDVRKIKDLADMRPWNGQRKRIFILDECHDLSREAWNALLKPLEDPSPTVMFLFATTQLEKVPDTIISRSKKLKVRTPPVEKVVERLAQICKNEGLSYEERALLVVAKQTKGHLRDAIKETAIISSVGDLTYDFVYRHLSLDVKEDMIEFFLKLKDDLPAAYECLRRLTLRLSPREIYRRLTQLLIEISSLYYKLSFTDELIYLEPERESSLANKLLRDFGPSFVRLVEYLSWRSGQEISSYDQVADVLILNRIVNETVTYDEKETPVRSLTVSSIDTESMTDLKNKLKKDVSFLYQRGRNSNITPPVNNARDNDRSDVATDEDIAGMFADMLNPPPTDE